MSRQSLRAVRFRAAIPGEGGAGGGSGGGLGRRRPAGRKGGSAAPRGRSRTPQTTKPAWQPGLPDLVPVGCFSLDRNGIICLANPSGAALLGEEHGRLVGRPFVRFLSAEDQPRFSRYLARVFEAGPKAAGEEACEVALGGREGGDGVPSDAAGHVSAREVRIEAIPCAAHDACALVVLDITARRRVEEALRKSEERYRLLVENISDALVVVQDGRAVFSNRRVDCLGYSEADYRSLPILRTVHPDDRDALVRLYREKIQHSATPTRHVCRALAKGGGVRWIDVRSVRIDWEGRPATLNLIADITEQRALAEALARAEQRFSEFVGRSSAGVGLFELAHPPIDTTLPIDEQIALLFENVVIGNCNELYATSHGYRRPEEMIGLGIGQIFPQMGSEFAGYFREFIAGGYRLTDLETRELLWDGSVKDFLCNINGLVEAGQLVRVSGAKQDITRIKEAERRLQDSQRQLRSLSEAERQSREEERVRIARAIHDELGGELTGLQIETHLLIRKIEKADGSVARQELTARLGAMLRTLESVGDVVRRIATELRPSVLDDLGLVSAIEWTVAAFARRTGIRCAFSAPPEAAAFDGPLAIELFRILQEALNNVARHAGATRVQVGLSTAAGNVVLEIRDDGRGIGQDELASPLALGLLGMRERAGKVGGRLTIEGAGGQGTRVRFELRPPGPRGTGRGPDGGAR